MPEKDKIEKNIEAQPSAPSEEVRIGVYTCYSGGNISDVVECERVAKA